jgi:hypothetical protein
MSGIGQHEPIPVVSGSILDSQLIVFLKCDCATHILLARFLKSTAVKRVKSRQYNLLAGTILSLFVGWTLGLQTEKPERMKDEE